MNIVGVMHRNARCFPREAAIVFEGKTITHAELALEVRALANALISKGMKTGDRIAIISQNCPEYFETYCAAAIGGLIAVGLNYRLSRQEQQTILDDCKPRVIFFEDAFIDRVQELRGTLDPATLFICFSNASAGTPAWATSFRDLIAHENPDLSNWPDSSTFDSNTWLLIYTSGTTGKPKGVMLSCEGQYEQALGLALALRAEPEDRMLIVMPFYHIGGTTEFLAYYLTGAAVVLHRSFDAVKVLRSIEEHSVTSSHFAPTMIQMMIDVQRRSPVDLSSLHSICYASAPMSLQLSSEAREIFGPIFLQIYGMTEQGLGTALLKFQHRPDGTPVQKRRLMSAGQAMLGVEVRVIRDDGSDCDVEEVGEVLTRSKALMQGYWMNPAASAEALKDGWMHTGDMGYLDDEAFLFIVDRKKDMIISGGENIYSREVEEALLLHPSVGEASVVGAPDPRWGESVKAYVSLREGRAATETELIEHCRTLIASYKKPRSVEFMTALPRITSTNKIDKRALREPLWMGKERSV